MEYERQVRRFLPVRRTLKVKNDREKKGRVVLLSSNNSFIYGAMGYGSEGTEGQAGIMFYDRHRRNTVVFSL